MAAPTVMACPASAPTLLTSGRTGPGAPASLLLSKRGAPLGARLQNVSPTQGHHQRRYITLRELRGSTGAVQEGPLRDLSREGMSCCIGPFGRKTEAFYAVKGPWMLKFKNGSAGARSTGVPIPLDGAEVRAVGDTEFAIRNCHVKDDFLGKGLSAFAGNTFVHSVCFCLEAGTPEKRDEWVTALRQHVERLAQGQARRAPKAADSVGVARSATGRSERSEKTTATAVSVNNLAARIFADFEEDEEFAVLRSQRPDLISPFPGGF